MPRKKTSKPPFKLEAVPAPADARIGGLSPEQADELRELIREINSKALEKREKSREEEHHSEHDPDLPPAA